MVEIKFDPVKTALIVIDMQKHFVDNEKDFPEFYRNVRADHIIENIAALISATRKLSMPIVFIKMGHRADFSDVPRSLTDAGIRKELNNVIEGTTGFEVIKELKPLPGDYQVQKRRPGAFYSTDLELLLRSRNIDTLLITGCMTGACVANTVLQARERDFHIIVISDGCASLIKESHEYWMKNMYPRSGRVRITADLITALNAMKK